MSNIYGANEDIKYWAKIDIKQEIINEFNKELVKLGIDSNIYSPFIKTINDKSIRQLFDDLLNDKINLIDLTVDTKRDLYYRLWNKFLVLRGNKYGNKMFWDKAWKEREMGYKAKWFEFVLNLLKTHETHSNSPVLILGCGDGREIPKFNRETWAVDILKNNIKRVKELNPKINTMCCDFENLEQINTKFGLAMALRCITPNNRINNLFSSLNHVMLNEGIFLCSAPLKYLDEDDNFEECKNIIETIPIVSIEIKEACKKFCCRIQEEKITKIEHFWLIKWGTKN